MKEGAAVSFAVSSRAARSTSAGPMPTWDAAAFISARVNPLGEWLVVSAGSAHSAALRKMRANSSSV
jgi:hypothetical protein